VELLSFPSRWLRTRRDNERFLCLVEAITFLHQHSRERGLLEAEGEAIPYVVATVEDYRLAYELAKDVLGYTLHELSRGAQELLELAEAMVAQSGKQRAAVHFTRRQLRDYGGWQDHRLRDGLQELVDMEYLAVVGGAQGRAFEYRLQNPGAGGATLSQLTTPDELAHRLGS
jgi:hypothetical protein